MFYDRYLALCNEKGVKPTNACIEAGLSRGLAAKWKSTGTEKPSADALEKLAAYFGKSIDEILGAEKEKTVTVNSDDLSDLDLQFVQTIKKLTEQEKTMLLAQMRALLALRGQ